MGFFKKLAKGEATWDDVKKGTREVGRAIDKNVIQPVIARPIKQVTKSNGGNIAKSIGSLFRRSRFRRMPKPKVVQQVQKAAQKTADKAGTAIKNEVKSAGDAIGNAGRAVVKGVENSAKDIGQSIQQSAVGQAINKAADKVGDVVRPAAPVLQRIGDKLGDAGREASEGLKRAGQQAADSGGQFLPYFTKIMPDAVGDVVGGVGRTAKGLLTADGGDIMSGIKRTGSGVVDALKHTGLGGLELLSRGFSKGPGDTIDPTRAGGYGPVQNETPGEKTSSPEVVETPQQKAQREEDEKTLAEYGQEAWDKFKDFSKMVIDEGIKPGFDSMDVKTKRMRYKDIATPAEIEVYRRAEAAGDKKLQDMMEAQWQYRQKYGRSYDEDLMQGRTYQQ
jgi:hypothetical protein